MKGVVQGALLTVAMRWADRLIGLVSTIVLARLLIPQDFGIIAMASLVIALADVFFDLGVYVSLIQNKTPQQEHFDTAWTMGLIQSALTAVALALVAPYAAMYFHEPKVEDVIKVLGLGLFISGCENIGVVTFQKELRFGQDFIFLFTKRISGFLVTLTLAWMLQSYWALVIGSVVGRVVGVVCSFAMHPMRPRLGLSKIHEILGVSQWLLAKTIGGYFESQLHRMVVGRRDTATVMGAYTLAGDISSMPTTELLMPINRVLFPAFVTVKDEPEELKRVFLIAQGVQTLIAIPASAGLAMVANEVVALLLGEKWLMAVPFVQIFAVAYLASAMLSSATNLMITLDQVKILALFTWAQVGLFVLLAYVAFPHAGALQIAWLRLLVSAVSDAAFVCLLLRVFVPLRWSDLVRGIVRPLIAVLFMTAGLHAINAIWTPPSMPAALIAKALAGALIYTTAIIALWWTAGRPAGPESFLFDKLQERLRRKQHILNQWS